MIKNNLNKKSNVSFLQKLNILDKKHLLIIGSFLLVALTAYFIVNKAFSYEGWRLSINWNKSDNPDSFTYDSATSETKTVRLNVKYGNQDVGETGYKPGELIITVPGLDDAYRSDDVDKAIGADEIGATEKTRAWSYTYNAATNIYIYSLITMK